ncbi:MFS general substrate transporter [Byssothecium circinans]|uniref:MFS general substrate transporter n=1 Tax=Byssothecium circinans TaxID=147558 RepID=A0A6A5U9E9_9PLEO|nr:MFS general substrate transporter [Byssothecium circinans]
MRSSGDGEIQIARRMKAPIGEKEDPQGNENLSAEEQNTPTTPVRKKKHLSFYLSFLALNISTIIVSLDATALAVAIPKITRELHGTTLEAFWSNLSFMLTVVISQPVYASVSDVLGRKPPFYTGFAIFFIGSIVFAVAKSMPVLIVGRLLQGLGGGGLDVLSEVILADITTLQERPLYLGLLALPMAGGGVCGPIVGAALTEYVTWRWIGWINLPLCALGFFLTVFCLHLQPLDEPLRGRFRRLDWLGFVGFAVGSTAFALPLSWAGVLYPWSSWKTILPFTLGFLVLIACAFYESKPAPIFPHRIFQNGTAAATILGATLHGMILYSVMLYVPLYFQAVMLTTSIRSAILVLPGSATIIASSILAAIIVEVYRKYRWIIICNWVIASCGVGLWTLWTPDSSVAQIAGLQVFAGIGIGTVFTALTIPNQTSVADVNDYGIAAGVLVCFRLFGGLIGLALCAGVFNNVFERRISTLEFIPHELEMLMNVREAISFIPTLREINLEHGILSPILEVYSQCFKAVFWTLTGTGALGLLTSFFIEDLTLEKTDIGRQQFVADVG